MDLTAKGEKTLEEQFSLASERFFRYLRLQRREKCRKWAVRLAKAAFLLHPELREAGSLERYLVAKLGRQRGYRGIQLTTFIDRAYESGLAKLAIEAEGGREKIWK